MKKDLEGTFWKMPDGEVIEVTYHRDKKIYIADRYNNGKEWKLSQLDNAIQLQNYCPTPVELWKLSEGAICLRFNETEREPYPENCRLLCETYVRFKLFVKRLIQFNYIKIDTRGYFGGKVYENLIYSLGGELGQALGTYWRYDDDKNTRKLAIENWAKTLDKNFLKPILINDFPMEISCDYSCHITGHRFQWDFDGETLSAAKIWDGKEHVSIDPFSFPNHNFPPAAYTIHITSGKIALFQWIEGISKDKPYAEQDNDVNCQAGRIEYSRYHESQNVWYLYVGGRARALYKKGEEYRIGNGYIEDYEDYQDDPEIVKKVKEAWQGWEYIGKISFDTDLRWFTGCDASKLKPEDYKKDKVLVIDVEPGFYTLIDNVENCGVDDEVNDTIFATFKKINS